MKWKERGGWRQMSDSVGGEADGVCDHFSCLSRLRRSMSLVFMGWETSHSLQLFCQRAGRAGDLKRQQMEKRKIRERAAKGGSKREKRGNDERRTREQVMKEGRETTESINAGVSCWLCFLCLFPSFLLLHVTAGWREEGSRSAIQLDYGDGGETEMSRSVREEHQYLTWPLTFTYHLLWQSNCRKTGWGLLVSPWTRRRWSSALPCSLEDDFQLTLHFLICGALSCVDFYNLGPRSY